MLFKIPPLEVLTVLTRLTHVLSNFFYLLAWREEPETNYGVELTPGVKVTRNTQPQLNMMSHVVGRANAKHAESSNQLVSLQDPRAPLKRNLMISVSHERAAILGVGSSTRLY